jgi:hypothetical protein
MNIGTVFSTDTLKQKYDQKTDGALMDSITFELLQL